MKTRCKVGDLAIIVGGAISPSPNLGKIVEVIAPIGEHPKWGFMWHVRTTGTTISARDRHGKRSKELECGSADAWLRPVSGLPIDEETREELTA